MINIASKKVFQESYGNRIIAAELEKQQRIKTYFGENDRTPNTDGYFEILNEQHQPIKRFVVQIKTTESQKRFYRNNTGEYTFIAPTAFINYIQQKIDENPAIYFIVDIENERVFYKYLSLDYLRSLGWDRIMNQQTIAIHLSENEILEEDSFFQLCVDIVGQSEKQCYYPIARIKENGVSQKEEYLTTTIANLKHIRRLRNDIWVNWKTGCVAEDYLSVQLDIELDNESIREPSLASINGHVQNIVPLEPAMIRLLSVLIQGEGAIVSWHELYWRAVIMSREMRETDSFQLLGEENGDIFRREKVDDSEILESVVESAVANMLKKAPILGSIIEKTENGYRIRLSNEAASKCTVIGETKKQDWNNISNIARKISSEGAFAESDYNDYIEAWLRIYYASVAYSFENRISNASESADKEKKVFGDYKMVEAYMNAYALLEESDRTETMLDFVEKWYHGKRKNFRKDGKKTYGKVLILYGEPGDGKTTFCKKAVYAFCFEGWLKDAPNVLWFSLNPNESRGLTLEQKFDHAGVYALDNDYEDIIQWKTTTNDQNIARNQTTNYYSETSGIKANRRKLDISGVFCIQQRSKKKLYFCDPMDLGDGALFILDGYDELVNSLSNARDSSTFRKFYHSVKTFAEDNNCNIIITARKMCIEEEIHNAMQSGRDWFVASFAPMTDRQQDMMIERMIELDEPHEARIEVDSKSASSVRTCVQKTDLKSYKDKILPELRRNTELKKLLAIPILFRMIVACRFQDARGVNSAAVLYSKLFYSLVDYKDREVDDERHLLREYEKIASEIFNYNEDTCPFEEWPADKGLLYSFRTKDNDKEIGQMGFLHKAFQQYFFARYLVSGIQTASVVRGQSVRELHEEISETEKKANDDFARFFRSLGARRITDNEVWRLVEEITKMKGKGMEVDPFSERMVTINDIEATLECLNSEGTYARGMIYETGYKLGANAENRCLAAAENALINLTRVLSAVEKGCRQALIGEGKACLSPLDGTKGVYGGSLRRYKNFCELLRRGEYPQIYLEGWNLSQCTLQRARMEGAYMAGANLEEADLSEARLKGADFTGVSLYRAELKEANLSESVLKDTNLENANLEGAYFMGADLSGAVLSGANLVGANLSGATFFGKHCDGDSNSANLSDANLEGADLSRANMEQVSFDGTETCRSADRKSKNYLSIKGKKTNLKGVIFKNANLKDAHLESVHLEGVDLSNANLTGAFLRGAFLNGANLNGACLDGAHLEGAHLKCSSLIGAVMKNAWLENADLEMAHLEGAVLAGADLRGARLDGAFMKGAYLNDTLYRVDEINSGVTLREALLEGTKFSGADLTDAFLSEEQYIYARKKGALGLPQEIPDGKIELPLGIHWNRGRDHKEKSEDLCQIIDLRIADRIPMFGHYPQRKIEGEKQRLKWINEPLAWRVLRREFDKILIITENLIDCHVYHDNRLNITWEHSELRRWMNVDFLNKAFNEAERERIAIVCNQNPNNKNRDAKGGNSTWDRVFALSIDEANSYFDGKDEMVARVNLYAKSQGSYTSIHYNYCEGDNAGWWWLRSPGLANHDAAIVHYDGGVFECGNDVCHPGGSVRPALWLKL